MNKRRTEPASATYWKTANSRNLINVQSEQRQLANLLEKQRYSSRRHHRTAKAPHPFAATQTTSNVFKNVVIDSSPDLTDKVQPKEDQPSHASYVIQSGRMNNQLFEFFLQTSMFLSNPSQKLPHGIPNPRFVTGKQNDQLVSATPSMEPIFLGIRVELIVKMPTSIIIFTALCDNVYFILDDFLTSKVPASQTDRAYIKSHV